MKIRLYDGKCPVKNIGFLHVFMMGNVQQKILDFSIGNGIKFSNCFQPGQGLYILYATQPPLGGRRNFVVSSIGGGGVIRICVDMLTCNSLDNEIRQELCG